MLIDLDLHRVRRKRERVLLSFLLFFLTVEKVQNGWLIMGIFLIVCIAAGEVHKERCRATRSAPTGAGEKPSGEKPTGEESSGEKPTGEKPTGEESNAEKPSGDMPSGMPTESE